MSEPADRTSRALGWLRGLGAELMPRTAIAVGIGTTIAMNVYGGYWDGGHGGALVAALYPVALVLSLEILIWVIRKFGKSWLPFSDHWEMWFGAATLGTLAAITGIISYLHALTVLARTGSGHLGWTAVHLGPLVPDQLILTGTLALMIAARRSAQETDRPKADQQTRTTRERTAKADQPDRKLKRTVPARAAKAERRAAEQARIVNLVRQLDAVPGLNALAAEHCRGNRRLARDVLTELARPNGQHTPEGAR